MLMCGRLTRVKMVQCFDVHLSERIHGDSNALSDIRFLCLDHNVQNCLAATVVVLEMNVDAALIKRPSLPLVESVEGLRP